MCYFNGTKVTKDTFIRLKHLEKLVASYNFPDRDVINGFDFGQTAILKRIDGIEDFEIVPMEWGFIPDPLVWPFWETREQVFIGRRTHKNQNGKLIEGFNFLNAVSEELLFKNKVYRKSALERRCLFLSTGYSEWRHIHPLNKRTGEPVKIAKKYPYRIGLKGREYFWIAGIWQEWTDAATGETVDTCALITTEAGPINAQIHNSRKRMPTMLSDDLAWNWLFSDLSEKEILETAAWQMPWQNISYYTLAKDFLNPLDPLKEFIYPESELPAIILPAA